MSIRFLPYPSFSFKLSCASRFRSSLAVPFYRQAHRDDGVPCTTHCFISSLTDRWRPAAFFFLASFHATYRERVMIHSSQLGLTFRSWRKAQNTHLRHLRSFEGRIDVGEVWGGGLRGGCWLLQWTFCFNDRILLQYHVEGRGAFFPALFSQQMTVEKPSPSDVLYTLLPKGRGITLPLYTPPSLLPVLAIIFDPALHHSRIPCWLGHVCMGGMLR